MLWERANCGNVVITAAAGSAHPVGAEAFLLNHSKFADPEPAASSDAPPSASATAALHVAPLGREAYAALAEHHESERGKLATGAWRDIATQMLPFLHPSAKQPAQHGRRESGRAALLLTGPERGGKATEALAAAQALGVHVFEVDCRQLAATPMDDAECIAALQGVLQQARPTRSCGHVLACSSCISTHLGLVGHDGT
jgi:hypothetical protein